MLPETFKLVAVATPRAGVVKVNEVASFAVVIEPSAISAEAIAPVSKLLPADKALTNAEIESQLALCSDATIAAPLLKE
jgi:hypothetical protein